jgi:hypothetical protein
VADVAPRDIGVPEEAMEQPSPPASPTAGAEEAPAEPAGEDEPEETSA